MYGNSSLKGNTRGVVYMKSIFVNTYKLRSIRCVGFKKQDWRVCNVKNEKLPDVLAKACAYGVLDMSTCEIVQWDRQTVPLIMLPFCKVLISSRFKYLAWHTIYANVCIIKIMLPAWIIVHKCKLNTSMGYQTRCKKLCMQVCNPSN